MFIPDHLPYAVLQSKQLTSIPGSLSFASLLHDPQGERSSLCSRLKRPIDEKIIIIFVGLFTKNYSFNFHLFNNKILSISKNVSRNVQTVKLLKWNIFSLFLKENKTVLLTSNKSCKYFQMNSYVFSPLR